jgi:hypothetical protein
MDPIRTPDTQLYPQIVHLPCRCNICCFGFTFLFQLQFFCVNSVLENVFYYPVLIFGSKSHGITSVLKLKGDFFGFFSFFYVCYSTLLHLPPIRFHCVGGCWVETRNVATLALTAMQTL